MEEFGMERTMSRRYVQLAVLAAFGLATMPAAAQQSGESTESSTVGEASESSAVGETEAGEDDGDEKEATSGVDEGDAEPGGAAPSEASTSDTDAGAESSSGGHPSTRNVFVVAPHVGIAVPGLFSDLGSWGIFSLELGVIPPIDRLNNPLEIAVYGHYTQPSASGGGSDPNLGEGGGEYDWEMTQRMLTLDLVAIWRGRDLAANLDPYGLIGPRLNLMETTMSAEGNGAQFGEVRETNTEFGMVFGGGVDYRLGPGTLFGELKFGWSNMDQRLTGDSNAGQFSFDVGYRFYPF